MCHDEVEVNGWTSVPANAGAIFGDKSFINAVEALSIDEIKFPINDPVVERTVGYAKTVLPLETFNHSMRVYYYGMAITKQQFPEQASRLSPSTWALTCLLHDIGTSEQNLTATRMSFDIYGGIKALDILHSFGATPDRAEAVAEAIVRHQDIGIDGTITFIGQLIQLATIYDNVGAHPYVKDFSKLVHDTTRAEIKGAHPPLEWRAFFSNLIQKEQTSKPWCHTTHIVNMTKKSRPAP
ncbi:hypothetical protein BBP40_011388 [Aspergillus hancockii]|nr:hypothetical protein BBP40_011388 [Aspergillus hancockii]